MKRVEEKAQFNTKDTIEACEYLESVAQHSNVKLENPIFYSLENHISMKACVQDTIYNDEDCIKNLLQGYRIKEMLETGDQFEEYKKMSQATEFLAEIDEEKMYQTYKPILRFVCKLALPKDRLKPEQRELIQEFRIRYLEERLE